MRGVGDTASKQQARRRVEMEGVREQRRIDPKFAVGGTSISEVDVEVARAPCDELEQSLERRDPDRSSILYTETPPYSLVYLDHLLHASLSVCIVDVSFCRECVAPFIVCPAHPSGGHAGPSRAMCR